MATLLAVLAAACGAGDITATDADVAEDTPTETTAAAEPTTTDATTSAGQDTATGELVTFTVDVWADNWFSFFVDGELVMEDSVPITTERSFNRETFTFEAAYPFTIGMVTKDFTENDTGLEYIGTDRQQMGDGGFIVQVIDQATGELVAATSSSWNALVVHQAPLDTSCETSATPEVDCESLIIDEPDGWADPDFDDSGWVAGTEHTVAAVDPKDGYDQVIWDPGAQLLWTTDLQVDNTILWRHVVDGA